MVWREKLYYACVGNKVKIALITKGANFFEISGRLKNRGKTTVFDWWREFRFGSKYREFKKKNREFEKSWFYCTSRIALNSNKRDRLKNPRLAQPEAACRLIHCRPFAHDWPLNFSPEDERLINAGLLEGMYSIVFACWNVDGAYKCLLCSSQLSSLFLLQISQCNRVETAFASVSDSFQCHFDFTFLILNFGIQKCTISMRYLFQTYKSRLKLTMCPIKDKTRRK